MYKIWTSACREDVAVKAHAVQKILAVNNVYRVSNQRMPWKQASHTMNGENLPLAQSLRSACCSACSAGCCLGCASGWSSCGCKDTGEHTQCTGNQFQHPRCSQGQPKWWISFRVFSTPYWRCGWTGGQLRAWMKARGLMYCSVLGLSCSWICGPTCAETLSGLQHRVEDVIQTHSMKKQYKLFNRLFSDNSRRKTLC